MIALSIVGVLLFYGFVYMLYSQYAQGKILATIALDNFPPLYLRLSPEAALLSLKWLVIAVGVYLVLDCGVALVRPTRRRRPRTPSLTTRSPARGGGY